MLTPEEVAKLAVRTLDGKKAGDLRLLRTRDVTVLADYFVIATASSTTQLKMLADTVSEALEAAGEKTLRSEGARECGWILVDFGCLVVHLFLRETREFYSLERLWSDAQEEDVAAFLAGGPGSDDT